MSGVFAVAWAGSLWATLGLAFLLWLAWGLGWHLSRALRLAVPEALDETLLSTALGLGVLAPATLLLGVTGGFGAFAFTLFFGVLSAAALASTRRRFAPLAAALRAWRGPWRDPATWVVVTAAAGCWLLAISPPVFYDTLVYHLGVPNLYLLRGGVVHLPNLVYASFPLHAEMLALLGLRLGGQPLAGLLHAGFAVLAAGVLASLVRRNATPAAGRAAAALFLAAPPVLLTVRFGTVEVFLALAFVLEVWCLDRWRSGEGPGFAAAAGLCAGWCFSTKYAGGLYALLPPLVFFIESAWRDRARPAATPRDALLLGAAAAAAALPWLAKNAVFTGNPVFPALHGVFGGSGWSVSRGEALLADAHAWWKLASSWRDFAQVPLDLVFNPARFGAAAASGWFWPAALSGAAVALRAPRNRAAPRLAALLAACLLTWAATFWLARLLIPAMALGAALAGLALDRLPPQRAAWRRALLAAPALWTAAALLLYAPARRSLAPALGLQSADDYLSRTISGHPAVLFVNGRLPPDSRVLVLGEARVAHLRCDHVHASALDPPPLAALAGGATDAAGIESALSRAGITHLLVHNRELERTERQYPLSAMDPALKAGLARFINERCRPLLRGGDVHLFELPGH